MWTYILITYIITQNRLFRMLKSKNIKYFNIYHFKNIFFCFFFFKNPLLLFSLLLFMLEIDAFLREPKDPQVELNFFISVSKKSIEVTFLVLLFLGLALRFSGILLVVEKGILLCLLIESFEWDFFKDLVDEELFRCFYFFWAYF